MRSPKKIKGRTSLLLPRVPRTLVMTLTERLLRVTGNHVHFVWYIASISEMVQGCNCRPHYYKSVVVCGIVLSATTLLPVVLFHVVQYDVDLPGYTKYVVVRPTTRAASLISRNAVTWHSSLSNAERVTVDGSTLQMLNRHVTMRLCKCPVVPSCDIFNLGFIIFACRTHYRASSV